MQIASRLIEMGGFFIADCRLPIANLKTGNGTRQITIGNRQSAITMIDSLTYTQLLRRNRSFRRLWVGQVISELGNWFNFIAGLGLGRSVSGASPEVTAALLILRIAPFAVFAPIAGALVDRWSRRTVMIVSDLARTVFAL